ncbi:translation initiation factor IF-2 [Lachnoanaerobaculum gingivalis]|uniref:Translation initiation factor IF-2 n=1 Tax=Lachnoanaerobaculum gingivalis TaxID=2490855 RepID=A0A3P3QZJ9_9FIRM|nr:translation initiation factor IF-2 [Lachnoanaerobaculum gingivalis]RRJ26651.1 translation initiation factor IF-2 [Lachnoanaerobaculum gingivalis]
MRVNDLAKEIGKNNNELIAYLKEKGISKVAMSNISADEEKMLREKFNKIDGNKVVNNNKENIKDNRTVETTQEVLEAKKEEAPKKKVVVFRPQNAQQMPAKKSGSKSAAAPKKNTKKDVEAIKQPQKKATEEKKTEVSKSDISKEIKKEEKSVETVKTEEVVTAKEPVAQVESKTPVVTEEKMAQVQESVEPAKPRNVYAEMEAAKKAKESAQPIRNIFKEREERDKARGKDSRPQNRDKKPFNKDKDQKGNFKNDRNSKGRDGAGNNDRNRNFAGKDNKNFQGANDRNNRNDRNKDFSKDENTGRSFGNNKQQGFKKNDSAAGVPVLDGLGKKTSNRVNKNNYKNNNKNDKKHRTEDGPAKGKVSKHPFIMPVKQKVEEVQDDIKEIIIPETITIKEFASKLKLQPSTIVKKLFLKGQIVTLNTELTFEQAEEIALEYDVICTMEEKVDVIGELLAEAEDPEETLVPRPPVVVVMGHVDHGKTSLLDAIRKTNVTSREAGGITQHIGAYMVKINGEPITFLDTPGHEAFTAMRMRGAQATDIAILVVAADDGVMPQTVEAINHAKAAGVEIIVAINKIDRPAANIDKVKQELSEYELIPEDWGGSTIFVPVSAKTGEGISNLLEMIILTAEVKELKANPNRKARGLVIEAELDKGKGPVARILVQKGTLHVGDFIAAGSCSGKVRAMMNDKGVKVKSAGPSTPVEILGLDSVPNAGEVFVATENDKEAKAFAATFISESKNKLIEDTKAKLSLDDLFSQIKAGNVKELPIVVKADVQGSVEAVKQSLTKLSNEEVAVKVIHGGVGAINESDVVLAAASNAIIIGFNVKPDQMAKATAERENVDLRLYRVIYQAIEDIESAMKGMLEPIYEEKVIGHAEIRQIFKASGVGNIAGSYVLDGKFVRGCKVRITRDGEQIFDGNLASLKRFKDDVKEVATGYECGLVFEKFNDIKEFDQVEAYAMVEVPRS